MPRRINSKPITNKYSPSDRRQKKTRKKARKKENHSWIFDLSAPMANGHCQTLRCHWLRPPVNRPMINAVLRFKISNSINKGRAINHCNDVTVSCPQHSSRTIKAQLTWNQSARAKFKRWNQAKSPPNRTIPTRSPTYWPLAISLDDENLKLFDVE